mmetsp:Transcript_9166/g.11949  ORF Transcript_9166/g.11949 Transcript_9166/m.11949 type:complete len:130 (+) Transcript_9166:498-887(+)
MDTYSLLSLIAVGALWGCTNSLIKKGGESRKHKVTFPKPVTIRSFSVYIAQNLLSLFMDWRFVLPFTLNQSGSLLYYILLGSSELSMAVPICNITTFMFTIVSGLMLGEKLQGNPICKPTKNSYNLFSK